MSLALTLALKGAGKVSPNPMVGAVVVKNGKVIATGYHPYFGGPHAEAVALSKAGKNARGAALYITLEPCCHLDKKTPPCVPTILKYGIKDLYIAMKDPNPRVNGKGLKILQQNGINCKTGILEEQSRELNKYYIKWITQKMPYVTLKWAMSLDGKIATASGDSKWITSTNSRALVHQARAEMDAILVGINTVIKDNPYLTSHGKGKNPVRVIIDPQLRIPLSSNVLKSDKNNPIKTIIFYVNTNPEIIKDKLEYITSKHRKCECYCINYKNNQYLKHIMKYLAKIGISSVLIEGGGTTHSLALEQGIADEVMAFISPKIIGGRNAITPVEGTGIDRVSKALNITNWHTQHIGEDLLITGTVGKKQARNI
ncbi:MAG: riboflavin biosynthesis protein RibD [Elusimicrobia bacterium RIFOXYA2_FULL_39_19]|nr:MAG: riboflavin biosynthesis protein RibD [Elusimicrobia bacterium RIFOXYA2_FULL_39_19]